MPDNAQRRVSLIGRPNPSPASAVAPLSWSQLNARIETCERCPRLRDHCQSVAKTKRAAFMDWDYWGKPVPNFGDPAARLLIVGLAPAAHGANRTGRCFTGDRSGEFLFRALFETGFANQPHSVDRNDGLTLRDVAIAAAARCAPPANKPTPQEIANCGTFLNATVDALPECRGVVALGKIAFDTCLRIYRERGWRGATESARPGFGHGTLYRPLEGPFLLASYHPSQQNTFTGKLTAAMLRGIFERARRLLEEESTAPRTCGDEIVSVR